MNHRGLAPVVGVALLIGITVLLAAAVALLLGTVELPGSTPQLTVGGTVDPTANALTIEHLGGDAVSVEEIDLVVQVDGEPLEHQPPVPFFSATGFVSGPTGPFNSVTDNTWSAGERGTIRLATTTNGPLPGADSVVTVAVRFDGQTVATAELERR